MNVPTSAADQISVREVLTSFETGFSAVARAVQNGEFALWIGSGVSRCAPDLGDLIVRAMEFLRVRTTQTATTDIFRPALEEALQLAGFDPADLSSKFTTPFSEWPERDQIVENLWNKYSRVLDIRIKDEPADFILWNAIDIRESFANLASPAAEHLCIAILILEGAVDKVVSVNWDGFIEAAVSRLGGDAPNSLQVVVNREQLRDAAGRSMLLKLHGCIVHATQEPETFRRYLIGSRTQITEWPDNPLFTAVRDAAVAVAAHRKSLVMGLSIQDNNLHSVFSRAKQVNPWPWPCAPQAPGHIFCEDVIKEGQRDILKIVYGQAYNSDYDAIHADTHLRAWGEQVLLALVIKLVADKLTRLMELALQDANKLSMTQEFSVLLHNLRDHIADLAIGDRTEFTNTAIATWSRLLSLFRGGALADNPEAYEVVSPYVPERLKADQNAQANGLGRLGVALSILQHVRCTGLWQLAPSAVLDVTAGALTARGNWPGAPERPLFLVNSAAQAIKLDSN